MNEASFEVQRVKVGDRYAQEFTLTHIVNKYDFYYPSLPAGTIFLKCFEAGKNEPLSVDRIKESSSVNIPAINSFSKIVDKREFTIYEGDWEEYYAVRVEVWHRDRVTHNEQKLIEKNYLMDGWMR